MNICGKHKQLVSNNLMSILILNLKKKMEEKKWRCLHGSVLDIRLL